MCKYIYFKKHKQKKLQILDVKIYEKGFQESVYFLNCKEHFLANKQKSKKEQMEL